MELLEEVEQFVGVGYVFEFVAVCVCQVFCIRSNLLLFAKDIERRTVSALVLLEELFVDDLVFL